MTELGLPSNMVGAFLFFGAFFFIVAVGFVIIARREKERIIYLPATTFFLWTLVCLLIVLVQGLPAIILFLSAGLPSVVAWPKMTKLSDRVYANNLRKIDLSAPLTMRDFLTAIAWWKLAFKGDFRKTVLLIWLYSLVGSGGVVFIMILLGIKNTTQTVAFIITSSMLFTFFYYRQIRRALNLLQGPSVSL